MTTTPVTPAERGLRLLPAKARNLPAAAQIQKLRRIAVRAMNEADWLEVGLGRMQPRDYSGSGDPDGFYRFLLGQPDGGVKDAAKIPALRRKVEDAAAAMQFLSR